VLRSCAIALGILIMVAALAVGGFAVTKAVRGQLDSSSAPKPTSSALARATVAPGALPQATAGEVPTPAAVAAALKSLVASPSLGGRLRADIVDVQSGTALYQHSATAAAAPASTAKLLTAAAVLSARGATYRITTEARTDDAGTLYLIGAGDPTLSGARAGAPTAYPGAARLSDLVAQLRKSQVSVARIVVVDSAFAGPAISPKWSDEDVPSDYASAITAFMADGGRATPTADVRSSAPDIAAGREVAALLGVPGAPVSRGTAPVDARAVASVSSAPISQLVEQMLQDSDNVIAECLARQVAIAASTDASFTGAAQAVRTEVTKLGTDPGAGLVDGSGLAASDRVAPSALAALLRVVASANHPELHGIVTALPVGAWSGTLADRYLKGSAGAGAVRAKTGTLTGVSTLAGYVQDADGRLLAFVLMADRVADSFEATLAAEAALDRIAARLAGCGCP